MLWAAIRDGLGLLTWQMDSFAYADRYDETAGRYVGLRGGQRISIHEGNTSGLLVRSEVARQQMEAERPPETGPGIVTPPVGGGGPPGPGPGPELPGGGGGDVVDHLTAGPKRFHGSVVLDSARVGRDAGQIAEEVIAHLKGLVGAEVTVTLEIEAHVPEGVPENVVRIVSENSRTLGFRSQGFEVE